jgi:CelD/BcsL family acetyltransferase involved in cellulose biosynthesis
MVELELDDPRWRAFVDRHPRALAFHRPEWARMIADCYGYRPFALAALTNENDVVAGVPVIDLGGRRARRWVTLPFTDVCPPLVGEGGSVETFALLLNEARLRADVRSYDLRAELPAADGIHLHSDAFIHSTALGSDKDLLLASFHRSQVQRNIRRGREGNVVVRRGETQFDLTRAFYGLHLQTRHRLGMPVQPRRFFAAIWRHLLEPGYGQVLLAYAGTKPIAGAVFLAGNNVFTYKYGASDAANWNLRANHLIFWTALQTASDEGFSEFDWGRSDAEDVGLREFKRHWAGVERPLVYSKLAAEAPAEGSGRALRAARMVLRRSPAFMCRATGELFYRYAA